MLGDLSMRYETGFAPGQYLRASACVSTGKDDPGGRSYGAYQLASRTGTLKRFLSAQGHPWAYKFAGLDAKDDDYAAMWKAVAADEGMAFFNAQHVFIKATHYDKVILEVHRDTSINLDNRTEAVRNAVWSMAVQHGKAATIIACALRSCMTANSHENDLSVLEALYAARTTYVDANPKLKKIIANLHKRYESELARALADAARAGVRRLAPVDGGVSRALKGLRCENPDLSLRREASSLGLRSPTGFSQYGARGSW